jgi:hypothetical protein
MHVETPPHTSENVRPRWQPGRQAVDRGFLPSVHNSADATFRIDPIQEAILVAGVLRPNLIMGFKPPEVPINIIWRTNIRSHGLILLRNSSQLSAISVKT